jgi:hypothetical protein
VVLHFMVESWSKIGPASATLDAYRVPADDED